MDDVTVALRQLKASPAFSAIAVLTLALGIGANSSMFAVADATLLRPLPFPDADRLVSVSEIRRNGLSGGTVRSGLVADAGIRHRTQRVKQIADALQNLNLQLESDGGLGRAWDDARRRMTELGRLVRLVDRASATMLHVETDRITPMAVPFMVIVGRESLPPGAEADESLLVQAEQLAQEAMQL